MVFPLWYFDMLCSWWEGGRKKVLFLTWPFWIHLVTRYNLLLFPKDTNLLFVKKDLILAILIGDLLEMWPPWFHLRFLHIFLPAFPFPHMPFSEKACPLGLISVSERWKQIHYLQWVWNGRPVIVGKWSTLLLQSCRSCCVYIYNTLFFICERPSVGILWCK